MDQNPTAPKDTKEAAPKDTKETAPKLPLTNDRLEMVRYYRQGWELAKSPKALNLDEVAINARLAARFVVDTSAAERLGREDASEPVPAPAGSEAGRSATEKKQPL